MISQRVIAPDARYNDKLVSKLINTVMRKGKKSIAEKICYQSFDLVKTKTGNDPLKIFKTAVDNVRPMVEVKSRRVA